MRVSGSGWSLALALLAAGAAYPDGAAAAERALHVPSPDWRDQVVYFLMIDRFDDGDPSNNDQGAGEYDPRDPAKFSGGDLRGVERRIGYIRGLGATAVWITPPVANQWWNHRVGHGGYHGYWAEDFSRVDVHFGSLDDYRSLSRALHADGMYLIQDVVLNHTADFFDYADRWREGEPAHGFARIADSTGRLAPRQFPFSMNDATDPAQRDARIYHWTPDMYDAGDRVQELTFQLSGLDDLDTSNPVVRAALRRSYGHWIEQAGVDAFRVDTAFHVPPDVFPDFLDGDGDDAPGVREVAMGTGRDDFLVFGEGFAIDPPFADAGARKVESYMHDAAGAPVLPSMINFPLYGSLGDVFARGQPTAVLGHRIDTMLRLHPRLHWMPSFIDNHDVDRFLAGAGERALRQALLALMTLPGIPTLYYGTEQGFTERRGAMFAGGYRAGAHGHFDTGAPLYRYVSEVVALRRSHPGFSRGRPQLLRVDSGGPGALVWRTRHAGTEMLVAFNTGDGPVLVDGLDGGWQAGACLRGVFGIDGVPAPLCTDGSPLHLLLPPRAGQVWRVEQGEGRSVARAGAGPAPTIDPVSRLPWTGDARVSGRARPGDALQIVVDGDLASAVPVQAAADGRWEAVLRTDGFADPSRTHRLVAWRPADAAASPAQAFTVQRQWSLAARTDDPAGDDRGPDGRYRYPAGPGWHHPGDLQAVEVETSGGALRITLRMAEISDGWNPPNGFDRVAPVVFIELPERVDGARAMPGQNAQLPGDMRWHYRIRANGWSNALFSAEGAGPDSEGARQPVAARLEVDRHARTIRFTLPATALGNPASLQGARVHVTTWDYDDGFRPLAPQPTGFGFSGGDGARDPRVLDAAGPLVLETATVEAD